LKERLEQVKEYVIVADRDIVNVKKAIEDKKLFNYQTMFGNENPVELEVGCGKGGFICQKANLYPNINYIAVELLENILVMAAESAQKNNLYNVKFFNSGAEYLPRYIVPNSISKIYLNFSPPYPQDSYENRRLTCDRNVKNYKDFLVDGGEIIQKTDDKGLFEYSYKKFLENGFVVEDISEQIQNGEIENILTEYESKFRSLGLKIYALRAKKS
jgi:tRNA (guanine-N7-)-methyltransferase